ncbi:VOC family protein [Micromonospora echinospora]|uniref:VOC family protein n=1 Tax=Micromonospora echinospora TaxID=1877 RepID=UPI0037A847FE
MSSGIHSVTVDCHDTYVLAGFWAEVYGCSRRPEDLPGDPEATLLPPDGPMMLFVQVPEGKTVKNRMHVCLQPADRDRDAEVERLLALGATQVDDQRRPDGTGWVVLADPEGNEFCIERSAAERAATA